MSDDCGSCSEGSSESKCSLEGKNQAKPAIDLHQSYNSHQQHNSRNVDQPSQHQQPQVENHHILSYSLRPALAALRKKRKKFSLSRTSTAAIVTSSGNNSASTSSSLPIESGSQTSTLPFPYLIKSRLHRASSVPARSLDLSSYQVAPLRRHEATQSQQPSLEEEPVDEMAKEKG